MATKYIFLMKLRRVIFKARRRQSGVSLVELTFIIIFLGVAPASTITMVSTGVTQRIDSESLSLASMLAEQKLEEIRGDKNGRGYFYLTSQNYATEANAGGYSGYTRATNITTYQNYKKVEVVVSKENVPSVTLVTFFTNY